MNLTIRQNINKTEIELNQNTTKYRLCCSIFAPYINLLYNTSFWYVNGEYRTEKDLYWKIDKSIDNAIDNKTLDLNRWWEYKSNQKIVWDMNLRNSVSFKKDENEFDEFLNNWYALQVYFYANKEFVDDIKDDWVINRYEDYMKYKWDYYAHTLNIYKQGDRYYTLDSVFPSIQEKRVEITDIDEWKKFIGNSIRVFL